MKYLYFGLWNGIVIMLAELFAPVSKKVAGGFFKPVSYTHLAIMLGVDEASVANEIAAMEQELSLIHIWCNDLSFLCSPYRHRAPYPVFCTVPSQNPCKFDYRWGRKCILPVSYTHLILVSCSYPLL